MNVIAIAAVTADGFIARSSDEVIHWSRDLSLFKAQTLGHPVIMGSRTRETLAVDLQGRTCIVVHRTDKPEAVIQSIDDDTCFVIGGGRTYTRFAPFLTHLYLTPHPLRFGSGIPLFPELTTSLSLTFRSSVPVAPEEGIYQLQFVIRS